MALGAIIGGSMALGAGTQLLGSYMQSRAADRAARQQRELGQQGADIIGRAEGGARDELVRGSAEQGRLIGQAGELFGRTAGDIDALSGRVTESLSGRRDVGDQALGQLQAALLGGDTSGFTQSPGYQFRLQQGLQAIDRASAARGNLGGGAHLKALTEYGQGVASQEYGNYLNQLMGMQGIGERALAQTNQAQMGLAGLRSSLLGQQAGALQQQAMTRGQLGSALAGLRTSTAANQANALVGAGSQGIQYDLAGTQALARGIAGAGSDTRDAALLYSLLTRGD